VDNDGKVFWKLKSHNDESSVLLQGNSQNPFEMMIPWWFGFRKFSKRKRYADVKMQDETASSSEEKMVCLWSWEEGRGW